MTRTLQFRIQTENVPDEKLFADVVFDALAQAASQPSLIDAHIGWTRMHYEWMDGTLDD